MRQVKCRSGLARMAVSAARQLRRLRRIRAVRRNLRLAPPTRLPFATGRVEREPDRSRIGQPSDFRKVKHESEIDCYD